MICKNCINELNYFSTSFLKDRDLDCKIEVEVEVVGVDWLTQKQQI